MRFVKLNQLPKLVKLDDLKQASIDIAQVAADDKKRKKFIKDNACLWTALRHSLWSLNGCKCWYSEAIIQADQGHIEHYRPKNAVAGESHAGYWWKAFEWSNYRLAHPTVNIRVTDYLKGQLAGKGTYFPLKPGCSRASCAADEANEEPVLLDPTIATDCRLLCFELTSGCPMPRFSKEKDEWLFTRADESIRYYHLDEGTWNVQRKDLIDEVNQLCDRIEEHSQGLPGTIADYETSLGELAEYMSHLAEFSTVAMQVVRERGLLEDSVPIQSK
jgi:hypothetical protein